MQMMDELHERLEILEARETARRELLRCIAHDLASPLTAMRLQLALWQDAGIDGAGRQRIERSIEQMTRLVDDVADLASLDGDGLKVRVGPTDLADVVAEVVDTFAVQADTTDITLRCVTSNALPAEVDRGRIVQVLDNLLRNALKFTPAGGAVTVEAQHVEQGLQISVSDSGRGLSPQDRDQLFAAYAQVHATDARIGTGLGLYICRRIVESHGGRIWAESEGRGKGSLFVVHLPAARPGAVGGSKATANGVSRPPRPGASGMVRDGRRPPV